MALFNFLKGKAAPVAAQPKTHVATVPTGRVLMRFTAVGKSFENEGSVYVPGMRYSIREGNKRLEQLARQWASEGKIQWL